MRYVIFVRRVSVEPVVHQSGDTELDKHKLVCFADRVSQYNLSK